MVEQLTSDYPERFAPLTMHVNDDAFTIPWGQNRLDVFYRVGSATPTFMVNTLWNCQLSDYRYYVEQELANPTDTTLELNGSPVGGSVWDITATICLEGGGSRQIQVLTAATLNHHPDLPSYSTNVLMQKVEATDINLAGGECKDVTTRFTFDPTSIANSSDIVIIAWAQKPATTAPTDVYQAGIMRWPFPSGSQLTTIEVSPTDVTIAVGEAIEFTAAGEDQSGAAFPPKNPDWSLGPGSGVGTFDPANGTTTTFTATMPGTRQILCSEGGVTGGALVTITEAPELTTITVDPAETTVTVDGQVSYSATGQDQYGDDFPLDGPSWSISGDGEGIFDPATGSATTLTATYPGNAVISCTEGGITATAGIEIEGDAPRVASVFISPDSAQLRLDESVVLTATGTDQYGKTIELAEPSWRIEGDGDGVFDPMTGAATTTFTATTEGAAQIICSDDGVGGAASIEISGRGLPAPRKTGRRVTP